MPTAIYPHIKASEGEPARLQRLPRVRVAQIATDYLAHGWSADEMCRHHPYLKPAEAHAAMAYYFDHQEQMDREIEAELEQARDVEHRSPRSSFVRRMRAEG